MKDGGVSVNEMWKWGTPVGLHRKVIGTARVAPDIGGGYDVIIIVPFTHRANAERFIEEVAYDNT